MIHLDAILGDTKVAIEIKSSEEIKPKHKKGLYTFGEEHPDARLIIVSLDKMTRLSNDIECIYVYDFLRMLWDGEII